jgi:hypothetical protein
MRKVLVLAGDARDMSEIVHKTESIGYDAVSIAGEPDEATLVRDTLAAGAQGIFALSPGVRDAVARATTRLGMAGMRDAATFAEWTAIADTGVALPAQQVVLNVTDAAAAVEALGTPVWLRPASLGDEPFRMILDHVADLPLVHRKVAAYAVAGGILVQQPVKGVPCVVVGFKLGRDFHAVEAINELLLDSAFEVPFGLSLPFAGGGLAYEKVIAVAHKAAKALPDGQYPLEMGFINTEAGPVLTRIHTPVRFDTGLVALLRHGYAVDLEADLLRLAVGDAPAEAPRRSLGATVRWIRVSSGTVKGVVGIDKAAAMPGVEEVHVAAQPGDLVGHLIDRPCRDKLGWVLATGGRRADAEARAEAAVAAIGVKTQKIH